MPLDRSLHLIPVENPARTALYRQLIEQRREAVRVELSEISPFPASLVWEIGCGHGHFLAAYAQAHPEEICIGVDIVGERIARAQKKRKRLQINNLRFIQSEAKLFLETLPARTQLSRIFLLFPDPWPKLRHHKHRIMQPAFLSALAGRAGERTRLYFRTDFDPYFQATREIVANHPSWTIGAEPWPFEFETVFQNRAPSYQSLVARPRPPN